MNFYGLLLLMILPLVNMFSSLKSSYISFLDFLPVSRVLSTIINDRSVVLEVKFICRNMGNVFRSSIMLAFDIANS